MGNLEISAHNKAFMPDSASNFNPPNMRSNFVKAAESSFAEWWQLPILLHYARHAGSTSFYFPRTGISSMAPESGVATAYQW